MRAPSNKTRIPSDSIYTKNDPNYIFWFSSHGSKTNHSTLGHLLGIQLPDKSKNCTVQKCLIFMAPEYQNQKYRLPIPRTGHFLVLRIIQMIWFPNGWFCSCKMVQTRMEIKWPFDFRSGF
jgi:hypothetical protein